MRVLSSRATDHPRIRGEHAAEASDEDRIGGIIPAYAGSTPTPTWSKSRFWDHPRIRGEH